MKSAVGCRVPRRSTGCGEHLVLSQLATPAFDSWLHEPRAERQARQRRRSRRPATRLRRPSSRSPRRPRGPGRAARRNASAPGRTGTSSCTALSYLEPGDSPTTTKEVFFDTEPATLPPREVIASAAESRVKPSSEPVTTTRQPGQRLVPLLLRLVAHHRTRRPATCATISRCQSTGEPVGDRGDQGRPEPSTSASSLRRGAAMRVDVAERARPRPAPTAGPMCRIDSATRNRSSGRVLASSRLAAAWCRWPTGRRPWW